ncbi:MAG: hypothetical protein K2N02_03570, partial [Alistipes sp.]|nr:hypothetical protein [Alistipes sp.]
FGKRISLERRLFGRAASSVFSISSRQAIFFLSEILAKNPAILYKGACRVPPTGNAVLFSIFHTRSFSCTQRATQAHAHRACSRDKPHAQSPNRHRTETPAFFHHGPAPPFHSKQHPFG